MIRNILATIAGLFVGSCFNMALVMLNAFVLYPMPAPADMNDHVQLVAWIETLPTTAFLIVVVAHVGQALVGGWVAARLSSARPLIPAMIVAALTLAGGLVNLVTLPGPTWMWIEVPLDVAAAFAAARIEQRRRSRSHAARS